MNQMFWMVLGPAAQPKHRHATEELARQEAERLAKSGQGDFFVLKAIARYGVLRTLDHSELAPLPDMDSVPPQV